MNANVACNVIIIYALIFLIIALFFIKTTENLVRTIFNYQFHHVKTHCKKVNYYFWSNPMLGTVQ